MTTNRRLILKFLGDIAIINLKYFLLQNYCGLQIPYEQDLHVDPIIGELKVGKSICN